MISWLFGTLLVALVPAAAPAQETCPDGTAPLPWIGAHALHCPGGACNLYDIDEGTSGPNYDFSSEPWLRAIDSSGPGAGIIEEGDVLVAVNGYLITTVRGGRELAVLPPGTLAELTVRRGDRLLQLEMIPQPRCERVMLLSGNTVVSVVFDGGTRPSADWDQRVVRPPGAGLHSGHSGIGAAFACSGCTIRFGDDDEFEWLTTGPVEVRAVAKGSAAAEAGLAPGDRIISINGYPMDSTEAGTALFRARVGDVMRFGIVRDGQSFETSLIVRGTDDRLFAEGSPGAVVKRGKEGWVDPTLGEVLEDLRALREAYTSGRSGSGATRMTRRGMTIHGDSWGPWSLGATFDCHDDCVWIVDDGKVSWELREYLTVKEVEPGGPADDAGLRSGDVLLSINGHDLLTPEAGELFAGADEGQALELVVRRDGRERTLTLVTR